MYPTITKSKTKELIKLGQKQGKPLPNHTLQEIMVFSLGILVKKNPPYGFFAFVSNLTTVSF